MAAIPIFAVRKNGSLNAKELAQFGRASLAKRESSSFGRASRLKQGLGWPE